MEKLSWEILFILMSIMYSCSGRYTLQIQLLQYRNPTDEDYNGGSCDPIGFSDCDVYFEICIRNFGLSASTGGNCWDTVTTSPSFESTSKTFPTTGLLYDGANANNPITFSSKNAWPGSFQLLVTSWDNDDVGDDDLIDRNAFNLNINPSTGQWSGNMVVTGFYGKVTFTVQVLLTCQANFISNDCTQCVAGYTGSNCTQCIPTAGCSNGHCTQPGECICNEGYTGTLCNERINPNTAASITSSSAGVSVTLTPTSSTSTGNDLVPIIGGAAGGVIVLVVLIVIIAISACVCFYICFKKRAENADTEKEIAQFQKNITYISPDTLYSSVSVKNSGSHYGKKLDHLTPSQSNGESYSHQPGTYDKLADVNLAPSTYDSLAPPPIYTSAAV